MQELKVWAFKITLINMLKALLKKEDNMQDQTGNFGTERDYKKNQLQMLKTKNIVTETKNAFLTGSLIECLLPMKKSVNLMMKQQKLYKLKLQREKKFKKTKKQNSIQELLYNSKWYNVTYL